MILYPSCIHPVSSSPLEALLKLLRIFFLGDQTGEPRPRQVSALLCSSQGSAVVLDNSRATPEAKPHLPRSYPGRTRPRSRKSYPLQSPLISHRNHCIGIGIAGRLVLVLEHPPPQKTSSYELLLEDAPLHGSNRWISSGVYNVERHTVIVNWLN